MAIVRNDIPVQTVEVFLADGTSLGMMNMWEFTDIRIQCKEQGVWGAYAVFEGIQIRIDKNGSLDDYPRGFFDLYSDQLMALI